MRKLILTTCLFLAVIAAFNAKTAMAEENAEKAKTQTQEGAKATEISEEEFAKLKKKGLEEARKIVVAKVNGANITMDQVVNTMNRLAKAGRPAPSTQEGIEKAKKEAIDRLIFQELAYQKAIADNIEVNPENIESAIANLKANLGGDEEAYKKLLEDEMLTEEELRAQIKRSLMLEVIFAREVLDKITVPDDLVKKEYDAVKHKYILPEKLEVIDVLFLIDVNDKKSMQKAKEVLTQIKADKKKDPWNLVLDGNFIVRNYEIKKDRDPILYKEARKLKPGQLSGVIKTDKNLHIVKVKNYSPERQLTFDEVKSSIEGKFKVEAQQKRFEEWSAELKKDAKIEILETEQSTEAKSQESEEKK